MKIVILQDEWACLAESMDLLGTRYNRDVHVEQCCRAGHMQRVVDAGVLLSITEEQQGEQQGG